MLEPGGRPREDEKLGRTLHRSEPSQHDAEPPRPASHRATGCAPSGTDEYIPSLIPTP